jgi:CrcB protein
MDPWLVVVLVAVGGAAGAVLRHVAGVVVAFGVRPIPEATLLVNVVASLLLGLIVGAGAGGSGLGLLGAGVCGALSTYSTFALEVDRLRERGRPLVATEYVATTLLLGIGAAFAGYAAGAALA